jgi:prepilin-type N-terminal cleavage/methylation domain-containing protein
MTRDDGFTLTETLVALALLAIVSAALAQAGAIGWRSLRASKQAAMALQIAQSLIAREGTEHAITTSTTSGDVEPSYHWVVETKLYGEAADQPGGLESFLIEVDVVYPDPGGARHALHLSTVKLARSK